MCKQSTEPKALVQELLGCTDPSALNYNGEATLDDGSCVFDLAVTCEDVDFVISFEDAVQNGTANIFNGIEEGVMPGDVIGISVGTYGRIFLQDLQGEEGNPIIVINCGGRVELGNENLNNAIILSNSTHVRLTGTGDTQNSDYGFFIKGSKSGTQGITATSFSSNIEIDHFEIMNTGFAGIMVKTDPSCDAETSAERGGPNKVGTRDFVMRDINIHDNYIHDVIGEAIYLGNSFYSGTSVYCDFEQFPHEVRGVRIYNNRIERTGWDAIQVGSAIEDVKIFNNEVFDFALANRSFHRNGIQVGVGTTGEVFGNTVIKGSGNGIFVQGIGDNYIYNNIVKDVGFYGIIVSIQPTPLATDIVDQGFLGGIYIMNNTIINTGDFAIREINNDAEPNILVNNLIVNANDGDAISLSNHWDEESSNLIYMSMDEAGFMDGFNNDFRLIETSDAIDAGIDASRFGVMNDFDGVKRPQGTSYDVGAFER